MAVAVAPGAAPCQGTEHAPPAKRPHPCSPPAPAACPAAPSGYQFLRQLDPPGFIGSAAGLECPLLGSLTVGDIAAQCAAAPTCVGFNVYDGYPGENAPRYCLKDESAPLTNRSTGLMQDPCHGFYQQSEWAPVRAAHGLPSWSGPSLWSGQPAGPLHLHALHPRGWPAWCPPAQVCAPPRLLATRSTASRTSLASLGRAAP
jgi:hypothetical protein